jgi:hypothetical protein
MATEDHFKELADHTLTTLAADTALKTGGTLAITTFERQFREDAGEWQDNELPSISARCNFGGEFELEHLGTARWGYLIEIAVTVGGGQLQDVLDNVNKYADRIMHVMDQQHAPTKQLSSVTDDLRGTATDLECVASSYEADGGPTGNGLRGVGLIQYVVFVDIETPID